MSKNTVNCDCSVELLLKRPFSSMKLEEKLLIIEKGKPKPDLELKAIFSLPSRKNFTRYFHTKLYDTVPWLCGCKAKLRLFCWPCLLFSKEETMWSTTGYNNLQNYGQCAKRHETSVPHIIALKEMKKFTKVFGKKPSPKPVLCEAEKQEIRVHNLRIQQKRFAFKHLARVVGSLGKLGIDLDRDDSPPLGKSYFEEMLKLVSGYNTELKLFALENSDLLLSHVREMTAALTEILICEVKKEISQASYLSLILDGVTDASKKDYVCATLRYIRENGDIAERLVRYWETTSNSSTVFEHIQQVLLDFNCASKLVSYSYDNAFMKPYHAEYDADLKERMKTLCRQAVYVHYYAHELVNVFLQSINHIEQVRLFVTYLSTFGDFFSKHENNLRRLKIFVPDADFKWDNPFQLAESVQKYRVPIEALLLWTLDNSCDSDACVVSAALNLLHLLKNFDFNFLLSLFSSLHSQCQVLHQGFLANLTQPLTCHSKVGVFGHFLSQVKGNKNKHFIDVEVTTLPSYSVRYNAMVCSVATNKTMYDKLYSEILKNLIGTLWERFKNLADLEFFSLLDRDQFKKYHLNFPLKIVLKMLEQFLYDTNIDHLKSELAAIYSDPEFRSVYDLHGYLTFQELEDLFPETLKLSRMLATIPLSVQPTSTSARLRDFVKTNSMSKVIFMRLEKDWLDDLLEQDRFLEQVVDKLALTEQRFDLLQKSSQKQPEEDLLSKPSMVLGSNLQMTTVVPSDKAAEMDTTAPGSSLGISITPDVDPPDLSTPGPSSQAITNFNTIDQGVQLAGTCDILKATPPLNPSALPASGSSSQVVTSFNTMQQGVQLGMICGIYPASLPLNPPVLPVTGATSPAITSLNNMVQGVQLGMNCGMYPASLTLNSSGFPVSGSSNQVITSFNQMGQGVQLVYPASLAHNPSHLPAPVPSSHLNNMEVDVKPALTCDIYPENSQHTNSQFADVQVKKESPEVSNSAGSLFQPPVLIKEEPVCSEEEL